MKTLTVGIASYDEMKARTLAIARGDHAPTRGEPKAWFTSIESLADLLSEPNRRLLKLIARANPHSLTELASLSGRGERMGGARVGPPSDRPAGVGPQRLRLPRTALPSAVRRLRRRPRAPERALVALPSPGGLSAAVGSRGFPLREPPPDLGPNSTLSM